MSPRGVPAGRLDDDGRIWTNLILLRIRRLGVRVPPSAPRSEALCPLRKGPFWSLWEPRWEPRALAATEQRRAWPGYGAIPCTVRAVTGQIPGPVGHRRRVKPQTTGKKPRLRPDAPRSPERPSTANDRHQQQPANMKLARALNPRAKHGNTLVMRSSLGRDEDLGVEAPTVTWDHIRRARRMPDRPVNSGNSRSLPDSPIDRLTWIKAG